MAGIGERFGGTMRYLAAVIIVTQSLGCGEPAGPVDSGIAPALPAGVQSLGSIVGRVSWAGSREPVGPIVISRLHGDASTVERIRRPNPHAPRVASDGGLADALVVVRGSGPVGNQDWNLPPVAVEFSADRLLVRQGDRAGRIGIVRRGDAVTFINREARFQSARARGDSFFSLALPGKDVTRTWVMDRTGLVEISSGVGDSHLRGYLWVSDQPVAAVTDEQGRFAIPGIPTGRHVVWAWHPNSEITRIERDPESLVPVRVFFGPAWEARGEVGVENAGNARIDLRMGDR